MKSKDTMFTFVINETSQEYFKNGRGYQIETFRVSSSKSSKFNYFIVHIYMYIFDIGPLGDKLKKTRPLTKIK
jgi:hypothetical protein